MKEPINVKVSIYIRGHIRMYLNIIYKLRTNQSIFTKDRVRTDRRTNAKMLLNV